MANEVTVTASLAYEDSEGTSLDLDNLESAASVANKRATRAKMNVAITEEAIPLADVTSLGWAIFVNRDATNFINIKTGTGGTVIIKIPPGKSAGPFHFGSGITAPYAIADTATCQMDYLIVQA